MKKNVFLALVGAVCLSAVVSCSSEPKKEVANHGNAVVIKYDKAVAANSVTPDAFTVNGKPVKNVFVTDQDPKEVLKKMHHDCCKPAPAPAPAPAPEAKPGEKPAAPAADAAKPAEKPAAPAAAPADAKPGDKPAEAKPEAPKPPKVEPMKLPESKDGQYVVLVLCEPKPHHPAPAPAPAPEAKPGEKPAAPAADAAKPAEKPAAPAAAPADVKPGEKPAGPAPEGKPAVEPKHECAPVGDVEVNQVKPIKTKDGKTIKAWKAPVKAALLQSAKPAPAPKDAAPAPKKDAPAAKPAEKPAEKK